jgi:CTP:molybdopterin cytidylyltransferase MocA
VTLLGAYHHGKTKSDARLHALVLAAGRGHRFGNGGKLHALYRGKPLLAHVLTVVEAACSRDLLSGGHVVIAAADEAAASLVRRAGLEPIANHAPELGLSHSLRLGLASTESGGTDAALIFLGDQPLVRLAVVEQLVKAWHHKRSAIIRPRYAARSNTPGHPVLLSRNVWPLARQLEGDIGFSALFDSTSVSDAVTLDVSGDNPDVDTQADLEALEKTHP